MNLQYLGDALDHWKGSLFERLRDAGVLRDFAVDIMATDGKPWQRCDFELLASLLRIESSQILRHRQSLKTNRSDYFDEITHAGDLFLDPDTGIKTGKVKWKYQYVLPDEIHDLLARKPSRVLAVYQHVRAQKASKRVQQVLEALRRPGQQFSCCSYESGTVAMLFLSREPSRVDCLQEHFKRFLGRHVAGRIHRCD